MDLILKHMRPLINSSISGSGLGYKLMRTTKFTTNRLYSSQSQQAQPKAKYFRFRNNPYTPIMLMLVFYSSFTLELIRLKDRHKNSNQRFRTERSGLEDLIKRVKNGEEIDLEKELELIRIRNVRAVPIDYEIILDDLMKQDEAWAKKAQIYEPNQETEPAKPSDKLTIFSENVIPNKSNIDEDIDFTSFFTDPVESEQLIESETGLVNRS
ncbi:hypothetical protein NADFUDRAFT_83574 [Nadsonia fulvescens var. elongata DSM 6958]|uniref:Uncharacterized protein n=1 Tax=Nadsonia fulvescens var. elongata DSM 6958 TaxID=857566 RepID=A0A1E3PGW9_9ASCO|nr:hypothetical protein NADFUDRAFT_83574 [Nadsonia fulvescens var. elongata DSM 6958]